MCDVDVLWLWPTRGVDDTPPAHPWASSTGDGQVLSVALAVDSIVGSRFRTGPAKLGRLVKQPLGKTGHSVHVGHERVRS